MCEQINPKLFSRQFYISNKATTRLKWEKHKINSSHSLFTHPLLSVSKTNNSNTLLYILGDIFNPFSPKETNQDICNNILSMCENEEHIFQHISQLMGRFVVLIIHEDNYKIFSDALGLKRISYYKLNDTYKIIASDIQLIKFLDPSIEDNPDPMLQKFLTQELPKVGDGTDWVGNSTPFKNVKHLLPNHLLDIPLKGLCRYWPKEPISQISLSQGIKTISEYLIGAMQAITYRSDISMAITAGLDSRTLFAAILKAEIKNVDYFIFKDSGLNDNSPDITIGRQMTKDMGKNHTTLDINYNTSHIPDEFKNTFFNSVYFAREKGLPIAYDVFYKHYNNKLNICGVGEVGRSSFGTKMNITPKYMAMLMQHENSKYAQIALSEWLEKSLETCNSFNIHPLVLLYWEQKLGNWGGVNNAESDISINEINPYNSHFVFRNMLGVDQKYRKYDNNRLFLGLIKEMKPELLAYPINPVKIHIKLIKLIYKKLSLRKLFPKWLKESIKIKFKKITK